MAGDARAESLDRLIADSEEAIKRLDVLYERKKKAPFLQRVKAHLSKNSVALTNVLLAGTVFVVAVGRLDQRQRHEAEREKWEAAQRQLEGERSAAQERAAAVLSSTEELAARLEAAAAQRRPKDLPQVVREQLADWRRQVSGMSAAAAAAAAAEPEDGAAAAGSGDDSSSSGSSGGRLMI